MNQCVSVENGAGVDLFLTPLLRGDCNAPVEATITLAAPAPADGNAAAIVVPTLATGLKLPKGMFLPFVTATTGEINLVQLAQTALGGETTLNVTNVPATIPMGATLTLPTPLGLRENASIERSTQTENTDLLKEFWALAETTGASWSVKMGGLFSQLDPTYLNAGYCFENNQRMYFKAQFPSPDPLKYSKGTIFTGEVIVTAMPIEVNKGQVKGSIDVQGNGKFTTIYPTPIAAIVP
jgi:hypothetical protein